jgi:GNAT superfamily N-acetyltransferase
MIRLACLEDAAAIAKVHVDSWRTTYRGIVPETFLRELSYEQRQRSWEQQIEQAEQNGTFLYVAETDGRMVGFISGGREREGDSLYKAELYALYILEAYQRQGWGIRLVSALVERLKIEGYASMLVWVLEQNPACRFYEMLGGIPVKQKELLLGGARLSEVAYGWLNLTAAEV